MPTDKFFSRQNIHLQIWAGIGGAIGIAFTTLVNVVSGPSKVVVDTEATRGQPISVNVVDGQGITKSDIERLTSAIAALNATASKQDTSSELRAVKSDLSKLQTTLAKQSRAQNLNPNASSKIANDLAKAPASNSSSQTSDDLSHQLQSLALERREQAERLAHSLTQATAQAEFSLPDTAKGYTSKSIEGVKDAYCPPEILRTGVPITVGFQLQDLSLLNSASPFMMFINRIDDKYSQTQVDREQVKLTSGTNSLTSTASLSSGTYEVSYGYYLKNKLTGEFPPFYSKVCKVRVPAKDA